MVRCRFHIDAEADSLVAARVLALISVRNELPEKFSCEKAGERVRIKLEMFCRDEPASRLLECKFQGIPTVDQVIRVVFPATAVSNVDDTPVLAFWI